ncbi:MAG: DNA-directed RNA polymerase subunit L [Thermoplasmata archaeon]|nr:DNA-directed RNA polymerase subunit L [Thermoplasmata archaeon]
MEVRLIAKDKDSMEIEVPGEDATLLSPLLNALLEDDKVTFATFKKNHPLVGSNRVIIRVSEGKPQTALKRAAKKVEKDFEDAIQQLGPILDDRA